MVICLQRGADFHVAQLMPLPLTVSCFSKFQTGFTFLVAAHPGSPGQRAVKRVCVCACAQCFGSVFYRPEARHATQPSVKALKDAILSKTSSGKKGKGKVFPYSLPNVGPSDPGVQAVSPQVT